MLYLGAVLSHAQRSNPAAVPHSLQPRCDHLARSGRNGSKGAQFLLWQAQQHESLEEALQDAAVSVACTRWVAGGSAGVIGLRACLTGPSALHTDRRGTWRANQAQCAPMLQVAPMHAAV